MGGMWDGTGQKKKEQLLSAVETDVKSPPLRTESGRLFHCDGIRKDIK